MKICENFSGNSLKEDLSIDTTWYHLILTPVIFRETVPLNPSLDSIQVTTDKFIT